MEKVIEIGTLYLDNQPVPVGTKYIGQKLGFGDTVPGMEIPFVKWNNLYVAAQCVCTSISWNAINKHWFIYGKPVVINNNPYLCRSLKVGSESASPNEWDDILNSTGEDNELWNWENMFFWGQEMAAPSKHAMRGFYSARQWFYGVWDRGTDIVGFRPVLEPLEPVPPVSKELVGTRIKVFGVNGSFSGSLIGYNDYDLELMTKTPLPDSWTWIRRKTPDSVFVDRDSIIYMKKE